MLGLRRLTAGFAVVVVVQGLAACGGSGSPTAPLPVQLVVFTDPASGFSTSDVHDVHEQVVRFNRANELIWAADDTRLSGYRVSGHSITAARTGPSYSYYHSFLVRFGTKNGERRAYLTWPDLEMYGRADHPPPTLLDVEIAGRKLVVIDANVVVPGS